jgi:group I intron endonuclease
VAGTTTDSSLGTGDKHFMYYLVYKTTNILNGKYYIGSHATHKREDGYIGSGVLLKQSIEKHGKENFSVEILRECKTHREMRDYEMTLVPEAAADRKSYNLANSGHGPSSGERNHSKKPEVRKKISLAAIGNTNSLGRKDSQETKDRRAESCAKEWTITFPDGHKEEIRNLHRFCREHNLNGSNMASPRRGKSKGYFCAKKTGTT